MAKYNVEEKKVLDKLNIKDFKHVNKNNIMELYHQLSTMTPEVAEKIIEQIGNFKDLCSQTIDKYQDMGKKVLESANKSQKKVYTAKMKELQIIEDQLKSTIDITWEQKLTLLDRINKVTNDMVEIDKEHKSFILELFKNIAYVFGGIVMVVASIFGVDKFINRNK